MKTALLIGVNLYKDSDSNSLRGCVYDAEDDAVFLEERGFDSNDIVLLLDTDAPKATILDELRMRIASLKAGDLFFWGMSSHGVQVPDLDGDEPDALDEALCPHDAMVDWPHNLIRDDEIAEIYAEAPRGATCVNKFDLCHSGNSTRVAMAPSEYRKARSLAGMERFPGGKVRKIGHGRMRRRAGVTVDTSMVSTLLAACTARQTAADAYLDGRYCGAYSWALKKAWRRRTKPAPLHEIQAEVLATLASAQFEQTPVLESADPGLALF